MYGGLPVALLGSLPALAWLGLPFWAFWDASMLCILVAMLCTRLGCLLNGCCCGRPSDGPLALRLPDVGGVWERRLPSQLLGIAWTAVLLTAALLVRPVLPEPGMLFLLCLAGYGIGRLALQPTRSTRQRLGRLELPLAFSAVVAMLSLAGLVLIRQ
jgi:phosphatidylglycerol:prolipoprotein diacylglycerol transferase